MDMRGSGAARGRTGKSRIVGPGAVAFKPRPARASPVLATNRVTRLRRHGALRRQALRIVLPGVTMRPSFVLRFASLLGLAAGASVAWAQATIVPADPVEFERISLRQTVDSCTFDPDAVDVSQERGTIVVVQHLRNCLVPGPPAVVDLQLGAFPRGEYRVEIRLGHDQPAVERIDFGVQGLVRPAVFPPPPAPLANYTGIWWTPAESGWGLSLHHGRMHSVFGALYVFGPDGTPRWYTLGSGQWESSTLWRGRMFASQGSYWGAPVWNAASVAHTDVGSVSFDFSLRPGEPDTARMDYSIGGVAVTKTISRIRH
jgi:hypothetical protein